MVYRPNGSVQHRGGNRWRLRIEGAPDPRTGRRRQLSRTITAPSRKAALTELAAFMSTADTTSTPTKACTLDELLDLWLDQVTVEANTKAEWAGALARYVRPTLGALPIAKVTTFDVDQLYRQLLRVGGRHHQGLAPATVRKAHTPLRMALDLGVRWGWLAVNPASAAETPTVPRSVVDPPTPAGYAHLLELALQRDPDFHAAIAVAANTGRRRGALCGLQWGDVDLEAGTIVFRRVVKLVDGRPVVREFPKNHASVGRIALSARAVELLRSLRARHAERALAAGAALEPAAFVFSSDPAGAKPWHPRVVTMRFSRLRTAAGLPTVKLHGLRHYMATQLLGQAVDVVTVAGRGGWANPNTLLRTYAAFLPANDRAAAEVLEQITGG